MIAKILVALLAMSAFMGLVVANLNVSKGTVTQSPKLLEDGKLDDVPPTMSEDPPTMSEDPPTPAPTDPEGLADTVIAAIVIGAVVLLAIICVVVYSFLNKRRMKSSGTTERRGSAVNQRVDEEAVTV